MQVSQQTFYKYVEIYLCFFRVDLNQFEASVGVTMKSGGVWMFELPRMSEHFVCQVDVSQGGRKTFD